jgi:hypothetical protein
MISIDSNKGRIGLLWWINSDLRPRTELLPELFGIFGISKVIRWGTCGIGRKIRISMEEV